MQWVASSLCTTSDCLGSPGRLDPAYVSPAGVNASLTYHSGSAAGEIGWDTVQIGNFTVSNQAMSACFVCSKVSCSSQFSPIACLARI